MEASSAPKEWVLLRKPTFSTSFLFTFSASPHRQGFAVLQKLELQPLRL
ncbi:hypothetical protein PF011_g8734 [Phytophthora fragariae]|uniref:Uncharacterized protein n=1 Tax=Phytophthora fragariae TaxID=53985 RepID=A0A6A3L1H5_9STRA|nr:hypothetical protein PF011_g8734 [Phytophthora fragariae]